jgi:spore coat protein CotH
MAAWADSLDVHKNGDEEYIPARFVWHKSDGDSTVLDSVGVRYKGNSSFTYSGSNIKKPTKINFSWVHKKQTFYDLEKLNLHNMVRDPSCMREKISYDLMRRLMPASRTSYVILSVDTMQIGLYLQVEDIDQGFLTRNFKDDQSNLYKTGDQGSAMKYLGVNASSYSEQWDLRTNEDDGDISGLIWMLEKLNNTTDSNFVKVAGKALDLDNCIQYLAYNMVTSNFDSYTGSTRNVYLYDDKTSQKFKLIPWDFNLGWGNFPYKWDVVKVDAFNFDSSELANKPLIRRVLANESLRQLYGKYILYYINKVMSQDTVAAMAGRIKTLIDSAVITSANNFYDHDKFLTNIESDYSYMESGSRIIIPGIKSFAAKRYEQLKTQLDRENILPVLNQAVRGVNPAVRLRVSAAAGGRSLTVRFSAMPAAGHVVVTMHNAKGEALCSFDQDIQTAGVYGTTFDTGSLPSGFYAVSLNMGKTRASSGVMLVKE